MADDVGLADLERIEDLNDVPRLLRNIDWLGWLPLVTAPMVPDRLVIPLLGQLLGEWLEQVPKKSAVDQYDRGPLSDDPHLELIFVRNFDCGRWSGHRLGRRRASFCLFHRGLPFLLCRPIVICCMGRTHLPKGWNPIKKALKGHTVLQSMTMLVIN
jgi:hypothetical protein